MSFAHISVVSQESILDISENVLSSLIQFRGLSYEIIKRAIDLRPYEPVKRRFLLVIFKEAHNGEFLRFTQGTRPI